MCRRGRAPPWQLAGDPQGDPQQPLMLLATFSSLAPAWGMEGQVWGQRPGEAVWTLDEASVSVLLSVINSKPGRDVGTGRRAQSDLSKELSFGFYCY